MLEERQTQTLAAVQRIAAPLVRCLLREGVGYQQWVAAFKPVFIEQAWQALQAQGQKDTDSAISLHSGVHRKDIGAWRRNAQALAKPPKRSVAAEVFARWIADPAYQTDAGQPRPLPRHGAAPSFETLAWQASQDVHPLTVLNELLRLGLAELCLDGQGQENVVLCATAFVPQGDWEQMLGLLVDNLWAHADTAVHNLSQAGPARLEQAVYAGGLSAASAQTLADLSRRLWAEMLQGFLPEAQRLHAQDAGQGEHVVRLGAYFHDQVWVDTAPESDSKESP